MTKNTVNIAIVGGGFSGTLATIRLVKLLSESQNSAQIFLIEKTKKLAKGLAYDTQCELHLLNVPAQDMSAFAEDKDHFINWLTGRFSAVAPTAFVSRKIYGEYLSEIFKETIENKSAIVEVEIINDEAIGLSSDEKHLTLSSGRTIDVDKLVIATGNFQPNAVVSSPSLVSSDAYFNNPWAPEALAGLSIHDNILLIGTGLTMIDLAIQLNAAGHQGIITAISRHGLLPNKHRVFNRLEGAASADVLPPVLPTKVREVFSTIRAACEKASNTNDSDWRLVVNQLRPHTQSIWKGLDTVDKKRFLRHARPLWEVLRHRMPPEVANVVEEMREDYRLRIVAGRLLTAVVSGNSTEVTMRLRRSGRVQTATYRRIINCTGPNIDLRATSDRFIQSLLLSGSILPDELGLGLQLDEQGYAIQVNNSRSETIVALGALRKGQLWETTAVPELRVQAAQLARQIVESTYNNGAIATQIVDTYVS
jgi:uncharacterized NAD(P)/FAD-binding protein YdhS